MSDIRADLDGALASPDLISACEDLTARWGIEGRDDEVVGPILEYMEAHGDVDYGIPGPLVHHLERFFGRGYEAALLESVRRRPTIHTLWMLNRVVNGLSDIAVKEEFARALELAAKDEAVEQSVRAKAADFLEL